MRRSSPQKTKYPDDDHYRLLMDNPHKFVEANQSFIKGMVQYFHAKGFIREQEEDDLVQSINEKLLTDRIQKMQHQYNASVELHIYFSKVVYNLCRELLRRRQKEKNIRYDSDYVERSISPNNDTLTGLIIEEELRRLNNIFRLYFKERIKLMLILKILSRIPLSKTDIKRYCPGLTGKEVDQILNDFHDEYIRLNNKEIYERINLLHKRCHHKTSSADSIRKWVEPRITRILNLMNDRHRQRFSAQYTKETLIILLRKYFESNLFENSNLG